MRKQRTFDNGSIPHQLHLTELQAIIQSQASHYPFFEESSDKIQNIFTFKIPYYVGPLARDNSRFAWVERISNEPIRPWNFEDMIDKEKSAESFILRMTNKDTYLPDEDVLPKHSLVYQEFTIFNEITKLKYVDERGKSNFFDKEIKEEVFEKLFKTKRKVSKKDILKLLKVEHDELRICDLKSLDDESEILNSSFSTYHDLLKIIKDKSILDDENNIDIFEDIVKTLTIFEDRHIIKKRLAAYEHLFDKKTINQLSKRQYTG